MPCLAFTFTPNVGPLLQLSIQKVAYRPAAASAQIASEASAQEAISSYMALVDSGASCTCVSPKVVRDIGLRPIGKQAVGGMHGRKVINTYQFKVVLLFPISSNPAGGVMANAVAFNVTGVEFEPTANFDVLMGRDVLCQGQFSMGWDGHATFCV
jgi:Aspartyl protease